ncbi:uncharacterized protein LOC125059061 [Pieris napi]|uniref:uncharacterized protein LOC125051377 n=1 Tax=Pieris napi TaxID=78633 RepID=UPI001FBBF94C|nr:uncharacterized protein LOC125051377 [Pieris napi]XP_047519214.1 uncharacterized protein LOC125059061 [Pieris napi]
MMTRRVTIKEMETKLRATLKELEVSKALCEQLLQERDDSEVEVKNVVDKNTFLKNELAKLHIEHMDLADQHNQLKIQVSTLQECSDTHELALNRISELEQELCDAHRALSLSESVKFSKQVSKTNSLFNELVVSTSKPVCEPAVTIDLTGDDTLPLCPIVMSHNKLKKYIKIKKTIKRSQRTIKKHNLLKLNLSLRKDRVVLSNKLNTCIVQLEECREKYDIDTQLLQHDLLYKEDLLKNIYEKYEISQQQLSERLLEAGELLDLVKCNAEMYESLTNNLSSTSASHPPPPQLNLDLSPPVLALTAKAGVDTQKNKTIFFCDEIGSGFGKILHNYLSHSFTNHSYHNISFKQIIKQIKNSNLDNYSALVLLLGNSIGITKKDIVDGVSTLLKLNIGKLMLCAFPYSDTLSEVENNHIFKLNNTIHMLTCRHSDKLLYFDTNKSAP